MKNKKAAAIVTEIPEHLVGEVVSRPSTIGSLYSSFLEKEERLKAEKKERKDKGEEKKKRHKSKTELELDLYDEHFDNYGVIDSGKFDPFLRQQSRFREGNVIPEKLELGLYDESGFFFGMKNERNVYIGKPAHEDGHIQVFGMPSSGKTNAIVVPTMTTWKGVNIIVDVKGDLKGYWFQLVSHTGKKLKIFSPGAVKGASCGYDPFALFRHDGPENLVGNARDLALALMPLLESIKDPVWIKAAQNFLTGAFIYYFDAGLSFAETMAAIQIKSVTEIMEDIRDDAYDVSEDAAFAAKTCMSKLKDVQDKVVGNIGMELSDLANLITDPAIVSSFHEDELCGHLDWLELRTATEPFDVILEFPEAHLEQWKPLMMLMINQLIKALERRPQRTYEPEDELPPVLVMLDEFPRLGKVSAIKNGLATLRSRGVTIALFAQSLAQIEEIYGNVGARVIADTCAYKVVLNLADPVSQENVSRQIGTIESTQRGANVTHDTATGRPVSYGRNIGETREPIIYPHEFLTQKDVVVINPHNGFCRVNKILFVDHIKMFMRPQTSKMQELSKPYGDSVTGLDIIRMEEEERERKRQSLQKPNNA